jgi:hypothetical protein
MAETSEEREEAAPGGRSPWLRRGVTALIALISLGGFAAVVIWSYDKGDVPRGDGVVPLIKAETSPVKRRPEKPGGMAVPDRDKQVFSRIDPDQKPPRVENLLPPPENVVDRPPPPLKSPPVPRPDIAGSMDVKGAGDAKNAGGSSNTLIATAKPKLAKIPPPPPPPVKAAPAKPANTTPAFRVQIASLRTKAAAQGAWSRLKAAHPDLFAGLKPTVVRADLGGARGIYFRLQVGPLADAAAAGALCRNIKRRKLGCIVVRP